MSSGVESRTLKALLKLKCGGLEGELFVKNLFCECDNWN